MTTEEMETMLQVRTIEVGNLEQEADRLIVANSALAQALKRAKELLSATADFIRINPVKEYTVHYDEADCDGSCLRDDCEIALKEIEAVLAWPPKQKDAK